jgi:hypothetical protein
MSLGGDEVEHTVRLTAWELFSSVVGVRLPEVELWGPVEAFGFGPGDGLRCVKPLEFWLGT